MTNQLLILALDMWVLDIKPVQHFKQFIVNVVSKL